MDIKQIKDSIPASELTKIKRRIQRFQADPTKKVHRVRKVGQRYGYVRKHKGSNSQTLLFTAKLLRLVAVE